MERNFSLIRTLESIKFWIFILPTYGAWCMVYGLPPYSSTADLLPLFFFEALEARNSSRHVTCRLSFNLSNAIIEQFLCELYDNNSLRDNVPIVREVGHTHG